MRSPKLDALFVAVALGVATPVAAQTTLTTPYAPGGDRQAATQSPPPPMLESKSLASRPAEPGARMSAFERVLPNGVDPAADSKCHVLAGARYWDCVNNRNGGQ